MVSCLGWEISMRSIVENFIAGVLAFALVFVLWISFVAEPLVIKHYAFEREEFSAGDTVKTVAKGAKPLWAVKFCTALKDTAYLRDETGQIAEFNNPVNFNDGSIKRVPNQVKIPHRFEPGLVEIWKRVVYRCFRFFEITASSVRSAGTLK